MLSGGGLGGLLVGLRSLAGSLGVGLAFGAFAVRTGGGLLRDAWRMAAIAVFGVVAAVPSLVTGSSWGGALGGSGPGVAERVAAGAFGRLSPTAGMA